MCKSLNLKKATVTIYKIRPNTIIHIFKKGQADNDEYDPREEPNQIALS